MYYRLNLVVVLCLHEDRWSIYVPPPSLASWRGGEFISLSPHCLQEHLRQTEEHAFQSLCQAVKPRKDERDVSHTGFLHLHVPRYYILPQVRN